MSILEANQKLLKTTPAASGRTLKEDGTVVNLADLTERIAAAVNDAGLVDSLLHGIDADGNSQAIGVTDTAAHVALAEKIAEGHARERIAVDTAVKKVTFADSLNINELTFFVIDTVAAASDANACLVFTKNTADATQAAAWLTEADSESSDTMRTPIPLGKLITLPYEDNITNVYFKAVGAETLRVWIIGGTHV